MALYLDGNPLGDAGLAALVALPHLARCGELALEGCDIGRHGLRALSRAEMPALKKLGLAQTEDGVTELAEARRKRGGSRTSKS